MSLSISAIQLQAAFEQEVKNAKDKQQRILEDATYEILELYSEYEKDIQEEKETAQMFEQELQLMDKNVWLLGFVPITVAF